MQGENVGRWGQPSADDHVTLAYVLGRQSSGLRPQKTLDRVRRKGLLLRPPEFSCAARPPGTGPSRAESQGGLLHRDVLLLQGQRS